MTTYEISKLLINITDLKKKEKLHTQKISCKANISEIVFFFI